MSDYISRQETKEYIKSQRGRPFIGLTLEEAILMMIDETPSADVVEVVRCKDCADWDKTWQPSAEGHYCPSIDLVTSPDFYCGYGERREDAEIH